MSTLDGFTEHDEKRAQTPDEKQAARRRAAAIFEAAWRVYHGLEEWEKAQVDSGLSACVERLVAGLDCSCGDNGEEPPRYAPLSIMKSLRRDKHFPWYVRLRFRESVEAALVEERSGTAPLEVRDLAASMGATVRPKPASLARDLQGQAVGAEQGRAPYRPAALGYTPSPNVRRSLDRSPAAVERQRIAAGDDAWRADAWEGNRE